MVRGARSGSSSRRSSRGRGLFQASASGSSSFPPPIATGSGEFTPPHLRVPAAGPSFVPPPVAACSGEFTSPHPRVPVVGPSFVSPPVAAGPVPEDAISLQEGEGIFYDSTLREVWINGDKIEPAQVSQFITRTIQAQFPGPIHRFNDFLMEVQESLYHMFMEKDLKWPPTFQEVFDKTHKKKGTDQYISDRAREVAVRVV
ncbi:hypothetical protein Taro_052439 [Colocasia esculenta]|uniref:Uncharacterized protein n=1 Tax=Colocasia esculenta TaxID=4460 RepID=A0A843XK24_COLES|nr:hypothetical protein [Colocasia esculenta]